MPTSDKGSELRERILKEMTIDYNRVLEKNFDLAKRLIRLTEQGDVEILVKDEVTGKEKILLYLLGKLYAHEVGFSKTKEVGNEEFIEKLNIPVGSLLPWLKSLREEKKVNQTKKERKSYHSIVMSEVEQILADISRKITK